MYASSYEYSFCYVMETVPDSQRIAPEDQYLKLSFGLTPNNTVTTKIQKKDGPSFSISGYMYLQGISPSKDTPSFAEIFWGFPKIDGQDGTLFFLFYILFDHLVFVKNLDYTQLINS